MPKVELTTDQKWWAVDVIINKVNSRRAQGKVVYDNPLDEYIDNTFNKTKQDV
ncbi:MAG: hypothetical protein GY861_25035 [bacterium]|nr:hypothetical protein [bacterium]